MEQYISLPIILSGVIAAIVWNLFTWWKGIPSSSSHTLIGGFAGAAIMAHGFDAIQLNIILKIAAFIFLAPFIGMVVAFGFTLLVLHICRRAHPHTAEMWFKKLQLVSSASDAAVYVDKVRERAGLSKLKDSRWKDCLSSKEVFIKRLQMERALELCFEGWRWADLKRWGLLDSQAGIDELKARDKDFNNFVIGKHKRMPIPTSEVEISKIDDVPQLTQNPNY